MCMHAESSDRDPIITNKPINKNVRAVYVISSSYMSALMKSVCVRAFVRSMRTIRSRPHSGPVGFRPGRLPGAVTSGPSRRSTATTQRESRGGQSSDEKPLQFLLFRFRSVSFTNQWFALYFLQSHIYHLSASTCTYNKPRERPIERLSGGCA